MGEYVDGKKQGLGKLIDMTSTYEGEFLNDEFNGFGKMTWRDGRIYEG